MRLKEGQPAPMFAAENMYGRPFSLGAYAGGTTLVSFYRAAVCPLCNLRLLHLIDRYEDYQRRGLRVIAFFESSPEVVHHYLDRHHPPFPIVADLARSIYGIYGLESSLLGTAWARLTRWPQYREAGKRRAGGNQVENVFRMDGAFARMPAEFLLGPDLRIVKAYYGRDAGDFMRFSEIERALPAPTFAPPPSYGPRPYRSQGWRSGALG